MRNQAVTSSPSFRAERMSLKHGPAGKVSAYADKVKVADPDVQCITIPWEVLKHPVVGPQVIEEINACLAISGRVGHLLDRLTAITDGAKIELFPRFGAVSSASSSLDP